MKTKLVAFVLSIATVVLLLTSCGSGASGTVSSGTWTSGQTSIKLLGGSWYSENGQVHVFYSAEATNKSSKTFDGGRVRITCLDEEGHGLNFSSEHLVAIAAGDTIQYSNSFEYTGLAPTSLDLHLMDNPSMYSDDIVSRQSEFVVSNLHSSKSDAFYTISGTISNNSSEKQGVRVSAIFKQDGVIVGGDFSYADPIDAGKSGTFTIYLPHAFEGCELYEVIANAY